MSVIDKSLEFLRPAQENDTHQQHEHDAIKCQDYPQWNLRSIKINKFESPSAAGKAYGSWRSYFAANIHEAEAYAPGGPSINLKILIKEAMTPGTLRNSPGPAHLKPAAASSQSIKTCQDAPGYNLSCTILTDDH